MATRLVRQGLGKTSLECDFRLANQTRVSLLLHPQINPTTGEAVAVDPLVKNLERKDPRMGEQSLTNWFEEVGYKAKIPGTTGSVFRIKLEFDMYLEDLSREMSEKTDEYLVHDVLVMGGWKAANDISRYLIESLNLLERQRFVEKKQEGYFLWKLKGIEEMYQVGVVTPDHLATFRQELEAWDAAPRFPVPKDGKIKSVRHRSRKTTS